MPGHSPTRPSWFRFSLRTLFVFVTLLCLGLGYPIYWIRQRHQFLALEYVFVEYYTYGGIDDSFDDVHPQQIYVEVEPPWILKLFGERGVHCITSNERFAHLPQEEIEARRLFPEAEIETSNWIPVENPEP